MSSNVSFDSGDVSACSWSREDVSGNLFIGWKDRDRRNNLGIKALTQGNGDKEEAQTEKETMLLLFLLLQINKYFTYSSQTKPCDP